jgi:hypothetical protein
MKKASLIALALLINIAFATGVFAQATTEPRQDTVPSTAPTGEKAVKAKKPAKKQSGVKEESTAESEGKKADKGPSPKAPRGGTHPGQ